MTLQPLVENVVKHGLEKRAGVCRLIVSAQHKGDVLIVEVADSGPGFAQEKQLKLLSAADGDIAELWRQVDAAVSGNTFIRGT